MNDMDDDTLRRMNAFLAAAGDVLDLALRQVASDAPAAVAGLQRLAAAGGVMSVIARAGACTGLAQVHVQITTPGGQPHTLLIAELEGSAQTDH